MAPEDTILGGKRIRKRQAVMAVMAAGNRDPERLSDPDRLDTRAVTIGTWRSAGEAATSVSARRWRGIEGQTAFELMLAPTINWTLDPVRLVWRSNTGIARVNQTADSF